jgi:hypothetical protein
MVQRWFLLKPIIPIDREVREIAGLGCASLGSVMLRLRL